MDKHSDNCSCKTCYDTRIANGTQDAYNKLLQGDRDPLKRSPTGKQPVPVTKDIDNLVKAVAKADSQIAEARAMPGDFIKNLFKTVQGVKFDDRCPHGLPYYACMSCSH